MIIDRVFTPSLAQVAYLVADESAREVAVIDPRRDVAAYIEWATERDFRITAIIETHVHADFVSGGPALAEATGAPIFCSRMGDQDFPYTPLDDGDEIQVGDLIIRALWTPGHTPEHMSYLLIDPSRGPEPVALFSGDSLFVGDVGRPDLLGESHTQELAEHLYATVSDRFSVLADDVVVYPGHTAGSSCGKKIGDAPDTTIGAEKRSNYAFQLSDQDEFIETVMQDMPLAPTYYPELKKVNKVGPTPLADLPEGSALSPGELATAPADATLVVDARDHTAFGEGHIPNAVAVGAGPNFLTWMGWLAPYDSNVALVLDDPDEYPDILIELRRIGIDQVAGYLDGGMEAWRAHQQSTQSLAQLSVNDLQHRLEQPDADLQVLDVRSESEWDDSHIAGASHVFAGAIAQGAEIPFDPQQPIAIICGTGYRSSVAASLLQQRGFTNLINITGGMTAWTDANLPTTS